MLRAENTRYFFTVLCLLTPIFGRGSKGNSNAALEEALRASYQSITPISDSTIQVGKTTVRYLASGPPPKSAPKFLMFCHGAAFTSDTWRVVGVLDELGSQGYSVVAPDLPGYGKSGPLPVLRLATADHREVSRDTFLVSFAKALGVRDGTSVVIVSASMGGTFAAPFISDPGPFRASGYVTVAGSLPTTIGLPNQSAKGGRSASAFAVPRSTPPALVIFGSEDPRLQSDRPRYQAAFPRSDVVVFDGAPHPAYLRDRAAAHLFVDLVMQFVGGKPSADYEPKKSLRLEVGVRVESRYFRGSSSHARRKGSTGVLPGTITKVHGDATYDVRFDDGDVEAKVPASFLTSLEYAGQSASGLAKVNHVTGRSEVMPTLKFKATW